MNTFCEIRDKETCAGVHDAVASSTPGPVPIALATHIECSAAVRHPVTSCPTAKKVTSGVAS